MRAATPRHGPPAFGDPLEPRRVRPRLRGRAPAWPLPAGRGRRRERRPGGRGRTGERCPPSTGRPLSPRPAPCGPPRRPESARPSRSRPPSTIASASRSQRADFGADKPQPRKSVVGRRRFRPASSGAMRASSRPKIALALATDTCCDTMIAASPAKPGSRRRSGGGPPTASSRPTSSGSLARRRSAAARRGSPHRRSRGPG